MKKRLVGVIVMGVIAMTLAVILIFNLVQPITNTAIAGGTGNWSGYTGALNLVQTVPLFNALILVVVAIGVMFAALRASGVA